MTTYLSAGFACTYCDSYAPTHDNGMFKYIVLFSQTGEWGMCCEACAKNGAVNDLLDTYFKQDRNGMAESI